MKLIKFLLFSFSIFLLPSLDAQEIHWTMYDMSPLTVNPANTGAYEGSYRVGGIYRDQFNSISDATGFQTPSFYIDALVDKGLDRDDWIGIGWVLYNDKIGSGQLTTLGTYASVAYHRTLNEKGTMRLSFGLQGGMVQRRIDPNAGGLTFEDELLSGGSGNSPNRDIIMGDRRFMDLGTGLTLTGRLNENTAGRFGVAIKHVNQPEYNLISGKSEKLPMRITAHSTFDLTISDKWSLLPGFLINSFENMNETVLQALVGYQFSEQLAFDFGAAYRISDAFAPILRVDYKDFRIGLSYDITVSELSDINNYRGSFEIGVWYTGRTTKKLEAKPVIFCPHF